MDLRRAFRNDSPILLSLRSRNHLWQDRGSGRKILPTVLIELKTKKTWSQDRPKGQATMLGQNLQAEASFPKGLFHETESQIGAKHRQTNGRENDSRRHCLGVNAQVSCPGKQGLMPKVRAVANQPNAHQNLHREKPLGKSVFGQRGSRGRCPQWAGEKEHLGKIGCGQKKNRAYYEPKPGQAGRFFFRLRVPLSLRR